MLKANPKSIYYNDNYGILHSHFKGLRTKSPSLRNSADPDDIRGSGWGGGGVWYSPFIKNLAHYSFH